MSRHGPESRSAARRKTAARSSKGSSRQAGAAASAASTAAETSAGVASHVRPSTEAWWCGMTTSIACPDPTRGAPQIVIVRSIGSAAVSSFSRASRLARSELSGAYWRTGSLTGWGGTVTASSMAP